ncbi:hypothetical protein H2198_006715 [Neophaeococcomyces mojaviensis]|uniref:Uncharacterized protein n=1 Tax=Neophaeococcomyces mojaviensis TaxID=3383035 RepID=A0ACC3A249_9EURO|nr:hypothetical protein H2198_006715 [Knufia sp. JES_112]
MPRRKPSDNRKPLTPPPSAPVSANVSRQGTFQDPESDSLFMPERYPLRRNDTDWSQESTQQPAQSRPGSRTPQFSALQSTRTDVGRDLVDLPVASLPRSQKPPDTKHDEKKQQRRENNSRFQNRARRSGNIYGKLEVKGNARAIRGNSGDDENISQNEYGPATATEQGRVLDGNVSEQLARDFLLGGITTVSTTEPEQYQSGFYHQGFFSMRDYRK